LRRGRLPLGLSGGGGPGRCGRLLLRLFDRGLGDFGGQLALHLIERRRGGGRLLLVGDRERLGLGGLGRGLGGQVLFLCLLAVEVGLRGLQRVAGLVQVAHDLLGVLRTGVAQGGRSREERRVVRLGRAVDVRLNSVVGHAPPVDFDGRLGLNDRGVDRLQRVLRVLEVRNSRVVLVVERRRLLFLLAQRGLDRADL
jgi:hypothetical protein